MARILGLISFLVLSLLVNGCSPVYVLRVGWGQARLIRARIPIEKVLEEGSLLPEEEAKIRLILEVKSYAREKLGLKPSSNYTDFVQVKEKGVSYALSACPQDSLEPYQWWFPIVGNIPYLGFFSKETAMKEKKRLNVQGYDTYLREVVAYSTLGWFRDPIFSSMLSYNEVQLADLIFHELFHGTVFVKDRMDFNESLATFVGQQGAITFFCNGEGEKSLQCRSARTLAHDDFHFSRFIEGLYERLHVLYNGPFSRPEKLARREEIFRRALEEFQVVRENLSTDSYSFLNPEFLNNAFLMTLRTYHNHIPLYQRVHERLGGDLRKTIDLFRQAARSETDPLAWLASWLGKEE